MVSAILCRVETVQAQSRQIKFERISLEQGLLPSSITCILQDRQGFVWFGTYDGLVKYDGYNFTLYKHSPLDSNSISGNAIFSICEDRFGALWIGTFDGGLNRFDRDKKQFIRFVNDPQNPHSLSHNRVFSIYEDRSGTLWIGTASGLNKLDRAAGNELAPGQFTRFVNDPSDSSSISSDEVRSIYEDRAGTLWIGTAGGLNRCDRAAGQFTSLVNDPKNPRSLSDNRVRSIYEDHSGTLWVGTQAGLNKLVPSAEAVEGDESVRPGASNKKSNEKPDQFIRFLNDPNDPHSLGADDVWAIYESTASQEGRATLWIATWGGGLCRLDRDHRGVEKFTRLVNDPNDPYSLSDNRVISIYEDAGGTLWIGTFGGRLNKFDPNKRPILHFANDPNNPHSLSHNYVRAIYEDRAGTLWVGTQNGLNKLALSSDAFGQGGAYRFGSSDIKSNAKPGQVVRFFNDPKNPHSLSHNNVRAICGSSAARDKPGALWIGTDGGGLNKFDPDTRTGAAKRFTRFVNDPENPFSLSSNRITALYEDRSGMLWIGTYDGGLNCFDPNRKQFTRFLNDPQNPHSLSHNRVWSIYEDHLGALWIGTSGGLNRCDRATGRFTRFVHDPNNPHSLSHNAVFSIHEDDAGALWIATYGGGLNKFERSDSANTTSNETPGRFINYTTKDGLSNDAIYGILADEYGHLWLSTNHGLSRFNPKTKTFRNYDETAGLQNNEFNAGAYFKSKRGEMFFGGVNGFNAFYPDQVKDNCYIPPVAITAFKIFDKPAKLDRAIETLEALTLSYQDNFFSFEFAALSYANPQKNQYAYKMEGFDQDWIYCRTRRYASYTNLDPGRYIFRVKGSNDDGVWNEAGAAIAITITPPWWRTRWAYASYVLSLIAGFVAVDRIQRRRVIKRERTKVKMRETELRAQAAEAQAKALQAENERKKNVELFSEIGKEITASLDFETIFYRLYEHINRLADATIFGVGIYHAEKNLIDYKLAIQKGKRYAPYTRDTNDKSQFPVWCIENRRPVFINDVAQEYRQYISEYNDAGRLLEDGTRSEAPQSLIYLPLIAHDRILGVITIQSFQKNAYSGYHLNILQNLAAYTTIALDNASAYRQLNAALDDLKATQQQLVVQEKLASLGMLTAGIAHEIKNPLNFVNNFAILSIDLTGELRDLLVADSEKLDIATQQGIREVLALLEQNIAKINEHGKRADSIVKSMLMHSRGESRERRPAEINTILDEYVALAYHSMRGQDSSFNIKIEKNYDRTIGMLEVVPQDLCRAFLNLVNNACYATHEKKKKLGDNYSPLLSVCTKNLGDKIEIRIRDNGTGIPDAVRGKIFTPFFTTKPAGQGVGLGLSITYDIVVQEHNGEIIVETEEGEFTEFVISLPRDA
jgi:ligand-binding sensor domain-containing protein/signal transduction histidine kinase